MVSYVYSMVNTQDGTSELWLPTSYRIGGTVTTHRLRILYPPYEKVGP